MKRSLWFGIVVSLLLQGSASADEKLKEALLARETELLEAIKQKDPPALKKLLATQAYSVDASGRRTTPQLLKILGKTTLTSYSITEAEAIAVGKNVGILTYKFIWSGTENDRQYTNAASYATSVWALREGSWVSVFYQETPLKE